MEKFIPILKKTQIFSGISEQEISAMFSCLEARPSKYKKGEYIFHQGEQINSIAVIVEGKVTLQQDDFWGNRSIISIISTGGMIGEAYSLPESGAVPHDAVAAEDSTVIFFNINKMLTVCSSACKFHSLVVQNLFFAISDKNRQLIGKLGHISRRSTREKLISYLSEQAAKQNSSTFSIPFNRQQLADYLSVDRSAMSNELCKMRDDGLLTFNKNNFSLQ